MKRILITGGPTNEYIDEVMKITNMSSGKIAVQLAEKFVKGGYDVTLCLTKTVRIPRDAKTLWMDSEHFTIRTFETTAELLALMRDASNEATPYDIIIHSAAVADYKPEYSFRLEDMAQEIAEHIMEHYCEALPTYSGKEIYDDVFEILSNPKCKVNDSTKISSVEPNLTVKLGLTPKIIASLRTMFPNAFICGFKLLENVPEEELVDAAMKQIQKCNTNLVFANDLAELRKGHAERLVITPAGYKGIRVDGAEGIYNLLHMLNA